MVMHDGHRERLKQRFEETGFGAFAPHEVLELLLCYSIPRRDTNELAHELIERFGSLSQVIDADYLSLESVKGIGRHTSLFISMIPQLFEKYKEDKQKDKLILNNSTSVVNYLKTKLSYLKEEEFHMLCLDNSLKLIKDVLISRGSNNQTKLDLAIMNKHIAMHNASNIILAHNHPNGEPLPSYNDDEATKAVIKAFSHFNIRVIDHFIIANEQCFSYYREGLLQGFGKSENDEFRSEKKSMKNEFYISFLKQAKCDFNHEE